MTDFPPPEGFTGYQSCTYGDAQERYERACTSEEVAILTADDAPALAAERAEDEELREAYFSMLRDDTAPATASCSESRGAR